VLKLIRPWLFALAAALAVLVALAAWRTLGMREAAPTVSYTLLDGANKSSDALRGKVVLVNFWATSCTTCVAEMPHMVETFNKFKGRGYEMVAVAMSYDQPAYVSRLAQSRGLPFGVVFDESGAVAKAFGDVQLTPTSFLIDKQGRIVKRYLGAPDFAALDKLIGELLAET
jgi:peroxiredoxin